MTPPPSRLRPSDGLPPRQPDRRSGWTAAASALVVGIALGILIGWVAWSGSPQAGAGAAPAVSPTGTPTTAAPAGTTGPTATPSPTRSAVTVTVPGACLRLARDTGTATALLDDVATAARNVDTERLADLVRRLGEIRAQLQREAEACRSAGERAGAATGSSPGS
jgi:hypothetical protein